MTNKIKRDTMPGTGVHVASLITSLALVTFSQVQDSKDSTAPGFPQVVASNTGVEACISGLAVTYPQSSVLLVIHVEEVIVMVPVEGGLWISRHSYFQTDVTAGTYSSISHFSDEDRWCWCRIDGAWVRHHLVRIDFSPFRGYLWAWRRNSPGSIFHTLFKGHLHLGLSHDSAERYQAFFVNYWNNFTAVTVWLYAKTKLSDSLEKFHLSIS